MTFFQLMLALNEEKIHVLMVSRNLFDFEERLLEIHFKLRYETIKSKNEY